jgi:hypothetical protein
MAQPEPLFVMSAAQTQGVQLSLRQGDHLRRKIQSPDRMHSRRQPRIESQVSIRCAKHPGQFLARFGHILVRRQLHPIAAMQPRGTAPHVEQMNPAATVSNQIEQNPVEQILLEGFIGRHFGMASHDMVFIGLRTGVPHAAIPLAFFHQ